MGVHGARNLGCGGGSDAGSGLSGWGPQGAGRAMKGRGWAARREARARETSASARPPRRGWAWGACWAHLGLLLGKAGLGRDEAQRGGIRVLVDLVEVVLQDLHLVLGGAARGVRRHGPGAAAGEREAAAVSEAAAGGAQGATEIGARPGALSPRGCPLPQSHGRAGLRRLQAAAGLTQEFLQGLSPGPRVWDDGRKMTPRALPALSL